MVHHNSDSDKVVTSVKKRCCRPDVLLDLVNLNLLYGLLASRDLKQNSVIADSFLQGHLMFLDRAFPADYTFSHNSIQKFTFRTVLSHLIVYRNNPEVITLKLLR